MTEQVREVYHYFRLSFAHQQFRGDSPLIKEKASYFISFIILIKIEITCSENKAKASEKEKV
jgi:hypothetical protein